MEANASDEAGANLGAGTIGGGELLFEVIQGRLLGTTEDSVLAPRLVEVAGASVFVALLGVAGFFVTGHHGGGHLLGVVHINTADNFLHIFLGVLITISGWISSRN